jgi:hypothetical protein
MRAVWSFWTKPFKAHHRAVWLSDRHHLLAWVLSLQTARPHCSEAALVTDDEGAQLLVGDLGLPFDHVSTELNGLAEADPAWWVLGKLHAYRSQGTPYIHLDNDVFLWRDLPARIKGADVFAQNPECFPIDDEFWYRPLTYDRALRNALGWVPEEWAWYTSSGGNKAICCGILGGNNVQFLGHYADLAIRMIQNRRNLPVWSGFAERIGDNILIEQYLLAACIEYHRNGHVSPFAGLQVAYLFDSSDDAFDERRAAQVGYTHLIGGAKKNKTLARRLEARVKADYPDYFESCCRIAGR